MNLEVCEAIQGAGGTPVLVGGSVRDRLMGLPATGDEDYEVFGLTLDALVEAVEPLGNVTLAGKSFGVLKLTPYGSEKTIDLSLPRRESKTADGHTGFEVEVDPTMSFAEAVLRRDFTINAIGMNPFTGEYLDPMGGRYDIAAKVLISVSDKFSEDPLRVLRGMQFAGRFDMTMVSGLMTQERCRALAGEAPSLSVERVWGEWYKWAALSTKPSAGLRFLSEAGWMPLYPEIQNMVHCPQDPLWHPEGDCITHCMHVCDAMATICDREGIEGEERALLVLSALCHDMGKPQTTEYIGGRWRSPGHAEAGVPVARQFLKSIGCLERMTQQILPLVKEHMIHVQSKDVNLRMARRLLVRLGQAKFRHLMYLMEADHSGRPPLESGIPEGAQKLASLRASLPLKYEALLQGRDLIELGFTPGKHFGPILKAAMEAQLEGVFDTTEGGRQWFLENVSNFLMPLTSLKGN